MHLRLKAFSIARRIKLLVMPRKDDEGSIWNFLAGLGIGFIGYAILSFFTKPICPICKKVIKRGTPICPTCKSELQWK